MSFRRVRREGSLPAAVWDLQASQEAGDAARDIIEERAFEDGLMVDGGRMLAYDPKYAERQGKTRVDLQKTGEMRRALAVAKATLGRVRVNAGRLRQVVFQNRARPWLGVGRDDHRELHRHLTSIARRAIDRARGR